MRLLSNFGRETAFWYLAAGITVCTITGLSIQALHQAEIGAVRESAAHHLASIATRLATQIDAKHHERLIIAASGPDPESSNSLKELRTVLEEAQETYGLDTPIYTVVPEGDRTLVVLDSSPRPWIGREVSLPESLFDGMTSVTVVGPYTDDFGRWLSASAPVHDTGARPRAMLVVDQPWDDQALSSFRRFSTPALQITTGSIVALSLISFLGVRSHRRLAAERRRRLRGNDELRKVCTKVERRERFLAHVTRQLDPLVVAIEARLDRTLRQVKSIRPEFANPILHLTSILRDELEDLLTITDASTSDPLACWQFSLRDLMNELRTEFTSLAEEADLEVTVEIDSALADAFDGPVPLLLRVLRKLIDNAIRYSELGNVCLVVRPGRNAPDDPTVLFAVVDNGPGLAPDHLDAIANPFDHEHSKSDSLGLSLAVCDRLVQRMGGQLTIESGPRRGVRASFEIELAQPHASTGDSTPYVISVRERNSLATAPEIAGLKVLVCEDEQTNLRFLCAVLDRFACEYRTARTGDEVTQEFREHSFDVVLLDCSLPDDDGFAIAKELRTLEALEPTRGRTPIIAVTTAAAPTAQSQCLRTGMDAVLTKPYRPSQLQERLLQVCLAKLDATRDRALPGRDH